MATFPSLFGPSKNKLLLEAAEDGDEDKVRQLLDEGANIEATDKDGGTALHCACDNGHVEIVKMLLAKGANIEATDEDGSTPLHCACWQGHVEIVKMLLAKGANIEATDKYGSTPLDEACRWGYVEIVKMLLAKGANMEATNKKGETPLDVAKLNNKESVVEFLTTHRNANNSENLQSLKDGGDSNEQKRSNSDPMICEFSDAMYSGEVEDTTKRTRHKEVEESTRRPFKRSQSADAITGGLFSALGGDEFKLEVTSQSENNSDRNSAFAFEDENGTGPNEFSHEIKPKRRAKSNNEEAVVEFLTTHRNANNGQNLQSLKDDDSSQSSMSSLKDEYSGGSDGTNCTQGERSERVEDTGTAPLQPNPAEGKVEIAALHRDSAEGNVDVASEPNDHSGLRSSARVREDLQGLFDDDTELHLDSAENKIDYTKSAAKVTSVDSGSTGESSNLIANSTDRFGTVELTDEDISFLRRGRQLLKDVKSIPVITEEDRSALVTLTSNITDFERSLESVRELPSSLATKGPDISTYFLAFTDAFERTFVAAQAIRTGAIKLELGFADATLQGLLSGASYVAEKSQLPFIGCISIFSAIITHQRKTRKANMFMAFEQFFSGRSRDQYLITYRRIAEEICLRLDAASLSTDNSSTMHKCKQRVRKIVDPVKKYLCKVHLLSIENLTPVEEKALIDLSSVTEEVLRLHQYEYNRYLKLCTSNELEKAEHFVRALGLSPLVIESPTKSSVQEGSHSTTLDTQTPRSETKGDSETEYETKKIRALEAQIQGLEARIQELVEAAGNNANIAQDLQQTKATLRRLEAKVASKKDLTVSSGCQAQMFVDPRRPVDERRQFEKQLDQLTNDVRDIISRMNTVQNHQVRQDRELEKVKVEHFIVNRVLSRHEAYVFTETLLINARDTDGKPMNILVAGDGRFELYGKEYRIGKVCKNGKTKSLWKGRVEVKMEHRYNDIRSIMDWFDCTDLSSIYERNKKQTILQMFSDELSLFSDELSKSCLSDKKRQVKSKQHEENLRGLIDVSADPDLR